jgi:hypothetical protein
VVWLRWLPSGFAIRRQLRPNRTGLTEVEITPCNDLLSTRFPDADPLFDEPKTLSNLDFALTQNPFRADNLYDLKLTKEFIQEATVWVQALQSRDETAMIKIFGRDFQRLRCWRSTR